MRVRLPVCRGLGAARILINSELFMYRGSFLCSTRVACALICVGQGSTTAKLFTNVFMVLSVHSARAKAETD